jgi:hypothetical protein
MASHFHADAPECYLTGNFPEVDVICFVGGTLVQVGQMIKIRTKKSPLVEAG